MQHYSQTCLYNVAFRVTGFIFRNWIACILKKQSWKITLKYVKDRKLRYIDKYYLKELFFLFESIKHEILLFLEVTEIAVKAQILIRSLPLSVRCQCQSLTYFYFIMQIYTIQKRMSPNAARFDDFLKYCQRNHIFFCCIC